MSRRVVVTGLGVVSPLGNTMQDTWGNLLAGKNAVGEITYFDTSNFRVKIAAELKNYHPEDTIDFKEIRRTDYHQHYFSECGANQPLHPCHHDRSSFDRSL